MYSALSQFRGQWVAVNLIGGETCLHGILQEVNQEYIKLYSHRVDGKKNTEYIRMDQITRVCPDAPELFESQMESAFSLRDDDEGKELVHAR